MSLYCSGGAVEISSSLMDYFCVKPKREKRLRVPIRNHGVEFLAHSWFILECSGGPFRGHLEIKLIEVLCIWLKFSLHT